MFFVHITYMRKPFLIQFTFQFLLSFMNRCNMSVQINIIRKAGFTKFTFNSHFSTNFQSMKKKMKCTVIVTKAYIILNWIEVLDQRNSKRQLNLYQHRSPNLLIVFTHLDHNIDFFDYTTRGRLCWFFVVYLSR